MRLNEAQMLKPSGKTQSDRVFEALRGDIITCRLLPGSKLRIVEIAQNAEVSLGAVREALSRLGAEGLVIAESQKGYRVTPISAHELRDLAEARIAIECLTLARSIERGDLNWESHLVASWHRLRRINEWSDANGLLISEEWASAHEVFHDALTNACGSDKLAQIRRQLYDQSERHRRYSGPLSTIPRNVEQEHEQIFEAAIRRDIPAATKALADHLNTTLSIILASPLFDEGKATARKSA